MKKIEKKNISRKKRVRILIAIRKEKGNPKRMERVEYAISIHSKWRGNVEMKIMIKKNFKKNEQGQPKKSKYQKKTKAKERL